MDTSHDKSKRITLIKILQQFLICEIISSLVTKALELITKLVVIQLEECVEVISSLLWRCAWAEEVCQFQTWSSQACVLKVHNRHFNWIGFIFCRVSVKEFRTIVSSNETIKNKISRWLKMRQILRISNWKVVFNIQKRPSSKTELDALRSWDYRVHKALGNQLFSN